MPIRNERSDGKPHPRRFEWPTPYSLPGFYPGATKRNALALLAYLLVLAFLYGLFGLLQ